MPRERSHLTTFVSARITPEHDRAIEAYAAEHEQTFSEALRSLLEIGLVATTVARRLPHDVKAYRLMAIPAEDADSDDPLLVTFHDD